MNLPDYENVTKWLRAFRARPKKSKILIISILSVVILIILVVCVLPNIRRFIGQTPESPRFLITNPFLKKTSTIYVEAESNSANSNSSLKIEYDGHVMKNAGIPIPDTNPQMWHFTLYDSGLPDELLGEGSHELRLAFLGESFSEISRIFISKKAHLAVTDVVKPKFPSLGNTEIQTIEVDSARAFIEAIQPNRIIKLKAGTYNLSLATHVGNGHVKWVKTYDGYEPIIHNLCNLTIVGEENTKLVIEPRYSWVLNFQYCRNIVIQNITIGHMSEGYCTGGVISFTSSGNILIENSIFFGSGTYGVQLDKVDRLRFLRSTIKNCTYGLIGIHHSANIIFDNSVFENTGRFDLISIHESTSNVNFINCLIAGNWTGDFAPYLINIEKGCEEISLINSRITDNKIRRFVNQIDDLAMQDNVFSNNAFSDFSDKELSVIHAKQ
ncbi:MAG: right-handed parallel beta-helix repeat-containing protein [Planctomycetes bacterium]|nr:right-handed parallel beta-helix repeat-containing protein [Planctomycetota bacterium]